MIDVVMTLFLLILSVIGFSVFFAFGVIFLDHILEYKNSDNADKWEQHKYGITGRGGYKIFLALLIHSLLFFFGTQTTILIAMIYRIWRWSKWTTKKKRNYLQ